MSFRPRRNFFSAWLRISYQRSSAVNCSAVFRSLAKKPAMRVRAARARSCSPWLHGHGGATGMACLPADGLEQQWPTRDGFAMMIGVGETHEQVPPVEHQRDAASHQAAALEVAGGEATPAPLVLQLVEVVLAIGAVAIELTDSQNLAVQRGHQHGVFPNLAPVIDRGEAEA